MPEFALELDAPYHDDEPLHIRAGSEEEAKEEALSGKYGTVHSVESIKQVA